MIRRCLRHCLATVEAGSKEGAQKKKGREQEEAEEDSRERESSQEWNRSRSGFVGIKNKASAHEDAKPTAQRTVGAKC